MSKSRKVIGYNKRKIIEWKKEIESATVELANAEGELNQLTNPLPDQQAILNKQTKKQKKQTAVTIKNYENAIKAHKTLIAERTQHIEAATQFLKNWRQPGQAFSYMITLADQIKALAARYENLYPNHQSLPVRLCLQEIPLQLEAIKNYKSKETELCYWIEEEKPAANSRGSINFTLSDSKTDSNDVTLDIDKPIAIPSITHRPSVKRNSTLVPSPSFQKKQTKELENINHIKYALLCGLLWTMYERANQEKDSILADNLFELLANTHVDRNDYIPNDHLLEKGCINRYDHYIADYNSGDSNVSSLDTVPSNLDQKHIEPSASKSIIKTLEKSRHTRDKDDIASDSNVSSLDTSHHGRKIQSILAKTITRTEEQLLEEEKLKYNDLLTKCQSKPALRKLANDIQSQFKKDPDTKFYITVLESALKVSYADTSSLESTIKDFKTLIEHATVPTAWGRVVGGIGTGLTATAGLATSVVTTLSAFGKPVMPDPVAFLNVEESTLNKVWTIGAGVVSLAALAGGIGLYRSRHVGIANSMSQFLKDFTKPAKPENERSGLLMSGMSNSSSYSGS